MMRIGKETITEPMDGYAALRSTSPLWRATKRRQKAEADALEERVAPLLSALQRVLDEPKRPWWRGW